MKLPFTVAVLMVVLLPACRVFDLRADPARTGVDSDALIEGYATIGFADDPSFFRGDVFDGNSAGSIFYLEVWYLLRFELGLVGVSFGALPFDVGIGTLFYHPRSPVAPQLDGHDHWHLDAPGLDEQPCPDEADEETASVEA